jgi:hypothetical protein
LAVDQQGPLIDVKVRVIETKKLTKSVNVRDTFALELDEFLASLEANDDKVETFWPNQNGQHEGYNLSEFYRRKKPFNGPSDTVSSGN